MGTSVAAITSQEELRGATVQIKVIDSRVQELLQLVSTLTEEQVEISSAVNTRLTSTNYHGTIRDVLTQLSREAKIEWFQFNGIYYVSDTSETTSRIIRLSKMSYDEAARLLSEAGITASSLRKIEVADGAAIVLTGPPKLIAFGEAIIQSLPADTVPLKKQSLIRIRRGTEIEIEPTPAQGTDATNDQHLVNGGDS
ncbi:hypothetical protein FEE96_22935 [Parasedimentitalea maritima]|uniref:Uncharacterized protein n=1 Tax=Parasedimentitalea maritima TaxID=2578117 RepID=A0ABY2UNQ6_9RHOB|nr:hypothetical protein [Zongyanglinia marina]TLP55332.1 hypothetical protein FEE96_22935 [Zongyanglinia marina]